MMLRDAVKIALNTIRTQKLKSFFSLLGVLIGVTFLIAVVSIVQGMNVYMEDQFANRLVGLNTFQLRRMPNFNSGNVTEDQWRAWQRRPRINYAEASYIQAHMKTPAIFSRYCSERMSLVWDGKTAKDIDVWTTDAPMFAIKNLDIDAGRTFTPQEARAGSAVAVIGFEVADSSSRAPTPSASPCRSRASRIGWSDGWPNRAPSSASPWTNSSWSRSTHRCTAPPAAWDSWMSSMCGPPTSPTCRPRWAKSRR
jgi:hypothetical protein